MVPFSACFLFVHPTDYEMSDVIANEHKALPLNRAKHESLSDVDIVNHSNNSSSTCLPQNGPLRLNGNGKCHQCLCSAAPSPPFQPGVDKLNGPVVQCTPVLVQHSSKSTQTTVVTIKGSGQWLSKQGTITAAVDQSTATTCDTDTFSS